ncbi:MAG: O-antigen ligase family protein [Candidatus Hydrogenedens sp.]|nr:O-antigen ligase family protein [Candidatus Hydrogenedens sp.]
MSKNNVFFFSTPVLVFILTLAYGFALLALLFVVKLPFLYILAFGLVFPFAILYLLLPLNYSATIFLLFIFLNHYYISPIIFPVIGLEIHPREIMLFMFVANFFVNLTIERVYWRWSLFLYFVVLYLLFFVYTATLGFLSGYDWHRVVAETRFPVFAITAFIFSYAWKSLHSLKKTINILFILSVVIAIATYGLFIYVLITGKTLRFQNFMGEFVPAKIGSLRLQEVRFNGHMLFDLWFVVFLSQFFYFKEWKKKIISAVVILFFIPPLLILMMNTALLTVFFASVIVIIIYLPSRLRLFASVLFVLAVFAVFFSLMLLFHMEILSWTNSELGISIQSRLVEITGAFENFMESPLLGKGLGSQFVGMGLASNFWQDLYALATFQTLHNLWMYWLFKGGIVGFSIIVIALAGILTKSGYLINILWTDKDKGFWVGYWACLVSQVVVMSLAFPRLSYPVGQVYLSFSIGIFTILEDELRKRQSTRDINPVLD